MTLARRLNVVLVGLVLTAAAACTPSAQMLDDPCSAAERPATLENLLENSFTNAYEACLAEVRDEAVQELEN